jgi:hypothetical protein
MARLHITSRCEGDPADLGEEAATAIFEKLAELRGQAPAAGELIAGLQQRPCASLHAGRYRAVTWNDREQEIVLLLAAGIHRADSREDAYSQAIALEQAQRLYPTYEDYARLTVDDQRIRLQQEADDLARLREEALAAADGIIRLYTSEKGLYAAIWAEVVAGLDEGEVVLRLRVQRHGPGWLLADELAVLVAAVFADRTQREQADDDLYRPRIQTLGGLPVTVMENAAPHRMSHAA